VSPTNATEPIPIDPSVGRIIEDLILIAECSLDDEWEGTGPLSSAVIATLLRSDTWNARSLFLPEHVWRHTEPPFERAMEGRGFGKSEKIGDFADRQR